MSDRSWFFAAQGQQHGPYPEAELREFIAKGTVTAEMLVWTEGMTGWQKAGDVPRLLTGGGPPAVPGSPGLPASAGVHGGEALSIELGLWSFFGRSLVFMIGFVLVSPAPWAATSFYRWFASRVRVPGRPNFAFTGQVGDIWYVFVVMALVTYAGWSGVPYLQYVLIPVQTFLSWMTVRWAAANLSSNGQPLPIVFKGSALAYVGWNLLASVSVITIIGWAWVMTASMRWICRNVSDTRREVAFNATGLGMLWRTLLFALGCGFLIPIPWVMRWYTRWFVSQFVLVQRAAYANA
jgi:hypothetical protein